MADDTNEGKFEISVRILGNEFVETKMDCTRTYYNRSNGLGGKLFWPSTSSNIRRLI